MPLIEKITRQGYFSKYYIMDTGYDWNEIYQAIHEVYKGVIVWFIGAMVNLDVPIF